MNRNTGWRETRVWGRLAYIRYVQRTGKPEQLDLKLTVYRPPNRLWQWKVEHVGFLTWGPIRQGEAKNRRTAKAEASHAARHYLKQG